MQAVFNLWFLLSVAVSYGSAQNMICATEALTFRAEPNTHSAIYGTLFPGHCFKSLHEEADGSGYHWAKVAFDGQVGWVVEYHFKYVTMNDVWLCACNKDISLNIRAGHTLQSHVLNVMDPWDCGRQIGHQTVYEDDINWVLIDYNGQTGWVSRNYIRTIYCG